MQPLQTDLRTYYDVFAEVASSFPSDDAVKFTRESVGIDENMKFLFNDLGYTEIFSDFHGNIIQILRAPYRHQPYFASQRSTGHMPTTVGPMWLPIVMPRLCIGYSNV